MRDVLFKKNTPCGSTSSSSLRKQPEVSYSTCTRVILYRYLPCHLLCFFSVLLKHHTHARIVNDILRFVMLFHCYSIRSIYYLLIVYILIFVTHRSRTHSCCFYFHSTFCFKDTHFHSTII